MTDTKELVERLREALDRIEKSPQRTLTGAGGQTMEASSKATIKQISLWDLETLYDAATALETLAADNARLEARVRELEGDLDKAEKAAAQYCWQRYKNRDPLDLKCPAVFTSHEHEKIVEHIRAALSQEKNNDR